MRMHSREHHSLLLGTIVAAGISLGSMIVPASAVADWCDSDMCSLDSGNCFQSHWDTRCRETAGGCEDEGCIILPGDSL